MTIVEITKIVVGILAALGGGSAIVLALSNYFGQLLVKQYEQGIRAKFENQINEYKSQLDILKQVTIRYSDKQFEHYSKLWASLYELKTLADDLWEEANSRRLEKFSQQLKLTNTEIEKGSLFIEEEHYKELKDIIKHFSEYKIGKEDLIKYRRVNADDQYHSRYIIDMIDLNRQRKSDFETLIRNIRDSLKKQIGGE